MIRPSPTRLLAPVALILSAACADHSPTAPAPAARWVADARRPDVIVDAMAPDRSWADFTVTPTGGRFVLGRHSVSFPDHAICDPTTSTYGPSEWKAPCQPLDRPIHIHAELRDANGHSWVDFTPSLRFVPTTDPTRYVVLTMSLDEDHGENERGEGLTASGSTPTILWAPRVGAPGVDDAAAQADPTLRTHLSLDGESVYRRIEHFTGYVIATGYVQAGLF